MNFRGRWVAPTATLPSGSTIAAQIAD